MIISLSKKLIEEIENAILSCKLVTDTSIQPTIYLKHYENAEIEWNNIQKSEINSYSQFASSSCGTVSYGFYKANSGKIYIIESFINEINYIYLVSKKIDCLKDIIDNKNTQELFL
jgi:hypothetical protein